MKKENAINIFRNDLADVPPLEATRIKNTFYRDNYQKLQWIALFIFICQVLFIIRDYLAGFYAASVFNYINLGAEALMGLYSLFLSIYSKLVFNNPSKGKEWTESPLSRLFYKVFMIILVLAVICFIFTDMYVRLVPFGLCLTFLLVLIITPFFDIFRQTIAFGAVILASAIIYLICFPFDYLGVIGVVLFPALLYVTSCFLRTYFINKLVFQKKMQMLTDELTYRNKTDFLTDVSSRFCLYDDFCAAKGKGLSVGIIMYDIDDFKKYNDTFSHIAGDDCLKKTCKEVKNFITNKNGKIYRYGGEEFVLLFLGNTREEFLAIANRINSVIYDLKIEHAPTALHPFVSISVGAVYSKEVSEDIEKLLLACDNALYKAKTKGKNCLVIAD